MKLHFKLFIFTVFSLFIILSTAGENKAHAENKAICSGCETNITKKYISVGEFTFHPECFVCMECGKPIDKHIRGHGPDFYHRDCYNKSIGHTCFYCKDALGDQWTHFEGKKYHPACYKKHVQLICTICGKAIEGRYTKNEEGAFHASCYKNTKLERCTVCLKPLEGRYTKDDWGNPTHESHDGIATSFCDSCGRVISKKTSDNGYTYEDGRIICGICAPSAVNDRTQTEVSRKKVLAMLSDVGLKNIPATISISLVNQGAMRKQSRSHDSENTKGFTKTLTNKLAGVLTSMDHSIYILNGLPRLEFEGVLAHELIHVWINENHIKMSKSETEGFCNLGIMLVNMSEESQFAQVLQNRITNSTDPIYGNGYRDMKKQLDKYGWKQLIQKIRASFIFPATLKHQT